MYIALSSLLCVLLAVLCPSTAFAYIDPGTGSILIQGLIGAIAAIGVTLKLYWHRIVAIFTRKQNDHPQRDRLGDMAESDSEHD